LNADAIAVATAEVGVAFCSIVLVTGPLWAKPVWGIWWTWDARLTSTFIMWLIYISYLLLRRFSTADEQTPKLAAALAIFGFVDVPIVYMSIRWWRTQHPSPVIGGGENSGLDPRMLHVLLWNFAAFAAYGLLVIWRRYQLERGRQQLNALYRSSAQGAAQ
jgi:heme exporter protein C